jgi:acyl transferase domain-containing protein
MMSPYTYSIMASEGILSPEGSCKPFDASADGFARAEAINAVYLKRLDDAIRDGNPIRGIIRNSGSNAMAEDWLASCPRTQMLRRRSFAVSMPV